jgi:hypothetical protein
MHKTQQPNGSEFFNSLVPYRLSDFSQFPEEDDESADEDDTLHEVPTIEHVNVNHHGGMNRIRSMPQNPRMVLSRTPVSPTSSISPRCINPSKAKTLVPQPPRSPPSLFLDKQEGLGLNAVLCGVT